MDWDRLAADRRTAKRDRLLARYLREEVHPFSVTEARRLDDAGLDGGKVRSAEALERIRPVDPETIDGIAAVLRPTSIGLSSSPDRFSWWWATLTGRRARFVDEQVDPQFRAIHFDDHGALVVASSAADLDRLADLGRRALGLAGVRRHDAVVTLLPARGDLGFWHLALGCRRGGVATLHLGDAVAGDDVVAYAPSVLAGTAATLRRVATESSEVAASVRLLLVTERLAGDERVDLVERYPAADVRAVWSPPGVRAPWAECTAGNLHTWPDAEIVQVTDRHGRSTRGSGSIVWTPLGWRGTVALRIRTGLRGRVIDEPCGCGATSPHLDLVAGDGPDEPEVEVDERETGTGIAIVAAEDLAPADDGADDGVDPVMLADVDAELGAVLDAEEAVAAWIAEVGPGRNRSGALTVAVWLAPVRGERAALEADLRRLGRRLAVDRLVVERPSRVRERLDAADGARTVAGGW